MYANGIQQAGLARLGSGIRALEAEAARLRAWLAEAGPAQWTGPTRCSEWNVHDVVAHLASGELYNQACLRDDIDSLGEWADDEEYNVGQVALRGKHTHAEVFAEWDERHRDVVSAWSGMDPGEPLVTSWGPYAVGLQAWHIASEYATHSDDIGVPVPPGAAAARLGWRFSFSRYAIEECDIGISTEMLGEDELIVRDGRTELTMDREQFVAGVSSRLSPESMTGDPLGQELIRRMKVLVGP
ncbi:maleylpyruvate isomerase family mycothiol-dependent enzyme [Streptomyces sp. CAU 1734]|uniref:maleylpyruvate isomerase family mycothiol-dependent enzyme n=1 Tax=Streptomyces sp. CAU 1734 TaxID=3140360 RepID=UPI00326115AD